MKIRRTTTMTTTIEYKNYDCKDPQVFVFHSYPSSHRRIIVRTISMCTCSIITAVAPATGPGSGPPVHWNEKNKPNAILVIIVWPLFIVIARKRARGRVAAVRHDNCQCQVDGERAARVRHARTPVEM